MFIYCIVQYSEANLKTVCGSSGMVPPYMSYIFPSVADIQAISSPLKGIDTVPSGSHPSFDTLSKMGRMDIENILREGMGG